MNRRVAALAGSVVVAVGVIAVVLVFGIIPLPAFDSLEASPDRAIPGTVAFFREKGEDRCLWTVPASGGRAHRVACRIDGRPAYSIGELAWTKEGELVVQRYDEFGATTLVLNRRTGETIRQVPTPAGKEPPMGKPTRGRSSRPDGAVVSAASPEQRVATIVVRTGTQSKQILRTSGPRNYSFMNVQWSPDGRWILAQDSAQRVLVVSDAGTARVLIEDGEQPAWYIPGNATYTVDPDQASG